MKRILTIALTLILMMGCLSIASAEGTIDFSGYTLEELLTIREELSDEIAKRPGGEKTTLGAGQYAIGTDIPEGLYTFKFVKNGDQDRERTEYYVYENESMYKYDADRWYVGDMPRIDGSLKGDGETRINLYSGEYLVLYYNGAEIERIGDVAERINDYTVPAGTDIPVGEYTVGGEIPVGTYEIYYSGTASSRVTVYKDADKSSRDSKEIVLRADNTNGIITLAEGNIVQVEYTPIIMAKSSGFTFD